MITQIGVDSAVSKLAPLEAKGRSDNRSQIFHTLTLYRVESQECSSIHSQALDTGRSKEAFSDDYSDVPS